MAGDGADNPSANLTHEKRIRMLIKMCINVRFTEIDHKHYISENITSWTPIAFFRRDHLYFLL